MPIGKIVALQNCISSFYMHWLVLCEEERTGQFVIKSGMQGRLNVVSGDPYVMAMIESSNPLDHFNFDLHCYKDNKSVGKCTFSITSMPESKLMLVTLPVKGSPDGSTITFSICWVEPYRPFTETPHLQPVRKLPTAFAIGHRGSGSNKVTDEFLENTMNSFQAAYNRGADYVEFDVQMTQDGVPVIFHDLAGLVSECPIERVEAQDCLPNGQYRYPVKKFTESEFRKTGFLTVHRMERVSLADLLTMLPEDLAFDVEVKYPSRHKTNTTIPYEDMNPMLDKVIDLMARLAGNRTMFFSCFDPLVCAMLRLKQQQFPVFQLFYRKKRWTQKEMAERVLALAPFHRAIGVEGFVFDCGDLLASPELVPLLQNDGFVLNTYGSLNNTRDGIERQLAMGIRGICTDDMKLCRTVVDEFLKTR
jgi:glycerophosphoryl diester phosphodiesterase